MTREQRQALTVGGAALLFLGSLGTWVTSSFLSVRGYEGDGVIFAGFAVAIAIAVGFRDKDGAWAIGGVVLALASVAYAVSRLVAVGDLNNEFLSASPGWGLFVMIVGGASAAVGCFKSR